MSAAKFNQGREDGSETSAIEDENDSEVTSVTSSTAEDSARKKISSIRKFYFTLRPSDRGISWDKLEKEERAKSTVPGSASNGRDITQLTWRQRFIKAARTVRMLCAVTLNLKKYASESGAGISTYGGVIEFARAMMSVSTMRASPKTSGGESISFDPRHYKGSNELKWPKKADPAIEKKPKDRNKEDIQTIGNLLRGMRTFRKLPARIQNEFCKVARLERYGRRRVVVRANSVGRDFYFVFSGSVCATLDEDEDSIFYKKEVSVLKKGSYFGEIAVMHESTRKATVMCMEDTELLAIDLDDFHEMGLNEYMQDLLDYRFNFLSQHNMFANWDKKNLRDVSEMGRLEEYNNEEVIVKDASQQEWLYFITKGKADVMRNINLAECPVFWQALEQVERSSSQTAMATANSPISPLDNSPKFFVDAPSPLPRLLTPTPSSGILLEQSRPRTTGNMGKLQNKNMEQARSKSASVRFNDEVKNKAEERTKQRSPILRMSSISRDRKKNRLTARKKSPVWKANSPVAWNSSAILEEDDDDELLDPPINIPMISCDPLASERIPSALKDKLRPPKPIRVPAGATVYAKIDTLRTGDVFGLQSVHDKMPVVSLVSAGCELIRVSMSKFRQFASESSMAEVERMLPTYPTDQDLNDRFVSQNSWNHFKGRILVSAVTDQKKKNLCARPDRDQLSRNLAEKGVRQIELKHSLTKIGFEADAFMENIAPRKPRVLRNLGKLQGNVGRVRVRNMTAPAGRPASQISMASNCALRVYKDRLAGVETFHRPTYSGPVEWKNYRLSAKSY